MHLAQPDFATELANHNVIFRIPTPLFGLGLVENTPDATLQANLAANASQKAQMGIGGTLNTSGNDGTVTRFGWKAQNKSLLIFAGEAYNVEQGVSNEVFPNERSAVSGCVFNATPEDSTNIPDPTTHLPSGTASDMSADAVNFAIFVRLHPPPQPRQPRPSETSGQGDVCEQRMRVVPFAVADDGAVDFHRHGQRDLSSLFRLSHCTTWERTWRMSDSRRIRSGPVPHRSAVGSGPTAVLLTRRRNRRSAPGD